jgi:RNA polymerase sigma-70 factor (ECF subfamily)
MPWLVDAALIAELFDRHAAALEFYAAQWTRAPQDCVQETFIELARQAPPPLDPAAWLFRVLRNRALNAARAERRRTAHEEAAARGQADRRRVADPGDAVAIADLLQLLAIEQREIVVLRVWGELSWQEIAEVVGSSRSATQRSYVQALEQLRKHLEPSSCPTIQPTNRP